MKPEYFEATQDKEKTTFTFYTAEQWGAEVARRRKAKAAERQRIARQTAISAGAPLFIRNTVH